MSGDEAPAVSVVIPTRDRWRLLSRALAGALRQEIDLEVLVVDDGSRDGTAERVREIGDERVRVLRHEEPLGVANARNAGIADARGDWLAFLDDDDYWAPDTLRKQHARADDDVALVYCGVVFVDAEGRPLHERLPPESPDVGPELTRWNVVGGPSSVLARAQAVREVGAFDDRLSVFADWDLWLRLAHRGRIVGLGEPLVAYVLHAGNMHGGDLDALLAELGSLREKHRRAEPPRRLEVDPVVLARWLAGGQRRSGRRLSAARTYLESGVRDRNPGNLVRAAGTLLGEPVLALGRRLRERGSGRGPAWLAHYRQ